MKDICPICKSKNLVIERISGYDQYYIECDNCGKYKITGPLRNEIEEVRYYEGFDLLQLSKYMSENKDKEFDFGYDTIDEYIKIIKKN